MESEELDKTTIKAGISRRLDKIASKLLATESSSITSSIADEEVKSEIKTPKRKPFKKFLDRESRKPIRSLVKKESLNHGYNWGKIGVSLISIAILIIGVFVQLKGYRNCDFWSAYERNFNRLVYGDALYCRREIDVSEICDELKQNLIAQDDAIKLIEGSLSLGQREKFIQIAFFGDVGVGKSLAATIISEKFYWKGNVQKYSYEENVDYSRKIIGNLSKCGFNLIIIDDIQINQSTMRNVETIEGQVRNFSKQKGFKTIIIFIFRGPQSELFPSRHFVVIDFEPISYETFLKCIELQAKMHNIELNPKNLEELKMLNYTSSGCKQIAKRLDLISQKYNKA